MYDKDLATIDATGTRIELAVSSYHSEITDSLCAGAVRCFMESGGEGTQVIRHLAPGAWELIGLCAALADPQRPHRPDAIVAIGCIITGETTHDQHIANGVVQGLSSIMVNTGIPIALGVLTCQTIEQAQERSGGSVGNKGHDSMAAAIQLAQSIRALREPVT
ncbi:MAG: 6,7-dimethyl-8-ribityllumazine synthase [Phycisphaerales bacterium]|nr:6,7-dimethyl-8-ribityllumazine synthase [Phycisphaerales bacterium]